VLDSAGELGGAEVAGGLVVGVVDTVAGVARVAGVVGAALVGLVGTASG
jgi:hypothetical protein